MAATLHGDKRPSFDVSRAIAFAQNTHCGCVDMAIHRHKTLNNRPYRIHRCPKATPACAPAQSPDRRLLLLRHRRTAGSYLA